MKYYREDRNNLSEDCHGHSGWRLPDCRNLGCNSDLDRACDHRAYESDIREEDEEYQEMVEGERIKWESPLK